MNKLRPIASTQLSEVTQRQGEEETAPRPERCPFQIPTFQELPLPWLLSQPKRPFSPALHLCFCPVVRNSAFLRGPSPLPQTRGTQPPSWLLVSPPASLPSITSDHIYLKHSNDTFLDFNLILDSPFLFYLPNSLRPHIFHS